jgi:hypothetical protein
MHLFASRRSERHAQARRITAGPIKAKHPRIEPVSLLGKPVSRSGSEQSELLRSRKLREYLAAQRSTSRNPYLYLGGATQYRSFV